MQINHNQMEEKKVSEVDGIKISDNPELYYMGVYEKGTYLYRQIIDGMPYNHIYDPSCQDVMFLIMADSNAREKDPVSSNQRRIYKANFENKLKKQVQSQDVFAVEDAIKMTEPEGLRIKKEREPEQCDMPTMPGEIKNIDGFAYVMTTYGQIKKYDLRGG